MKTKNTQKEIGMIQAIQRSATTSLSAVYGKCSSAKWNAYNAIKETCDYLGGRGFRITSAMSQWFCCGFFYTDKQTGVLRCRYYTGRNVYDFEILNAIYYFD